MKKNENFLSIKSVFFVIASILCAMIMYRVMKGKYSFIDLKNPVISTFINSLWGLISALFFQGLYLYNKNKIFRILVWVSVCSFFVFFTRIVFI
jgi:hypothetical protein